MCVLEFAIEELRQGLLVAGFARGAVATVIHCEDRIQSLWSKLIQNPDEQLPWEAPLIDIARNHHGNPDISTSLGDVVYFQPGHHNYIGRKIEITRSAENELQAHPSSFVQGDEHFEPHPQALLECWWLVDRIMLAMTPEGWQREEHKVTVQRLKYQDHRTDCDSLARIVENSLGRWGRVGFAMDRNRESAPGPLSVKGLSDFLGMLMLLPLLRHLVSAANGLIARFDRRQRLEPGEWVIERPHLDSRYFSALCGTRDTVRTQVYVDGNWVELPIGLNSIVVFPGERARQRFGLRPTLHRVIHVDSENGKVGDGERARNVTLLIGANAPA